VAGGNAFYLKTGIRRGDLPVIHDQSATDANLAASASKPKETALADAAPKSGVMQWLYATFAQADPVQVLRSDSHGIRRNVARLRGRARCAIDANAQTKNRRGDDPPAASGFVWQTHS
jgi:hypothetical protein